MTDPSDDTLDDAAGRLAVTICRLNRMLRRKAPTGLGAGSLSALATVVRTGPVRLGDLAAREQVAPPSLTRMVSSLEEAGYLVRTPDPADRRASTVRATPAAQELIRGTGSGRAAAVRERLAALSRAELEVLLAAVPVLESLVTDDGTDG